MSDSPSSKEFGKGRTELPTPDPAADERANRFIDEQIDELKFDAPRPGWPKIGTHFIRTLVTAGSCLGDYLTGDRSGRNLSFEVQPSRFSKWDFEFRNNGNTSLPNVLYYIRNSVTGKYLGTRTAFGDLFDDLGHDDAGAVWQVFRTRDGSLMMRSSQGGERWWLACHWPICLPTTEIGRGDLGFPDVRDKHTYLRIEPVV